MPDLRNFIAGEWQRPAVSLGRNVCDSNTGRPVNEQAGSSPEQIDAAIAAAAQAHSLGAWQRKPGADRADVLRDIAMRLEAIVDDMALADSSVTGVPISQTRIIGKVCGAAFRAAADLAEEPATVRSESTFIVERLPLGPVAIIGPWNAPSGIACHKLASALAAGCPVLFKPSEWAPQSGQMIAEVIADIGLPDGVFQLLHGDGQTGAALVADARIAGVSFTGGLDAGRAVAQACALQIKPAQLELGGNNPFVVLPGADLDAAADGAVAALTTLNGQWCRALGRLIVHSDDQQVLLTKIIERLQDLTVGDSTNDNTQLGPLVHEGHRAHVMAAIKNYQDQGGELIQVSRLPQLDGWFLSPTLITGLPPRATTSEIFGPVATVHAYDNVEQAIQLANQAPYGLAAYVFGERDAAFAFAKGLECGMVKVNTVTLFSPHASTPRPAWKLSGIGDEGTRETFEFFRGSRVIGVAQGVPE